MTAIEASRVQKFTIEREEGGLNSAWLSYAILAYHWMSFLSLNVYLIDLIVA